LKTISVKSSILVYLAKIFLKSKGEIHICMQVPTIAGRDFFLRAQKPI
jgi:hypothetical protein